MKSFKHIEVNVKGSTGQILLNRPDVHNALHIDMIRELSIAIEELNTHPSLRLISLVGKGKNFSAGADLNWMKEGLHQPEDQLRSESKELALLFNRLYHSDKVTIAIAKGKVMGGAIGLLAASDISLVSENTSLAFTEVKLGLIPATIYPYVALRAGISNTKEWMLSGRSISAHEAASKGLVHTIFSDPEFDAEAEQYCINLLNNGPEAMKGIKALCKKHGSGIDPDKLIDETAGLISTFRTSGEGQEGMRAFFEKRKPNWINE